MKSKYAYIFFPNLTASKTLQISNVTICNSDAIHEVYSQHHREISELSKIIRSQKNEEIQSLACCVIPFKNNGFRGDESKTIQRIQNILGYIYSRPMDLLGQLHYQCSDIASMYIFEKTAYSSNSFSISTSSTSPIAKLEGGNDFEMIEGYFGSLNFKNSFCASENSKISYHCLAQILDHQYDISQLLEDINESDNIGLKNLIHAINNEHTYHYDNFFTAIEWYCEATRDIQNPKIKIISLSIAFESLLGLPREDKTSRFSDSIAMILGRENRLDEWAKCFYGIRSEVVHEGRMENTLFSFKIGARQPHEYGEIFEYGLIIFQLCFETLLYGKCTGINWNIASRLESNHERLNELQTILNTQQESEWIDSDIQKIVRKIHGKISEKEPNLKFDLIFNVLYRITQRYHTDESSLSEKFWNEFAKLQNHRSISDSEKMSIIFEMYKECINPYSQLCQGDATISFIIGATWMKFYNLRFTAT